MRLKRLEVRGFKTFASPVTLTFDSPITAIVGPNGSGKSNLADAVRWALGEQSARLLRTKRTEDVIFAGGVGRAQMGMAEVALTLDNASGWLDVPYAEVCLMRRAFRSGDNEYFINGTRVRLRDLTDLVLKANAGPGSVVIGQGMVDLALSMRPEERRFLFEEAADVKRHALKIKEAQDKLSATEDNMRRVADLAAELAPRVASLERQAERARRHAALSAELRGLMVRWYRLGWDRAQSTLRAAGEDERTAAAALQSLAAELDAAAADSVALAERRQSLSQEIRRSADEATALAQALARAQMSAAVSRERRGAVLTRLEEGEGRLRDLAAAQARAATQMTDLLAEHLGASEERTRLEGEVANLAAAVAHAQQRRAGQAGAVVAAEAELERLTEAWGRTGAIAARLAEGHAASEREREARRRAEEEAEAQLAELAREAAVDAGRLQSLASEAAAAVKALEAAEAAVTLAERDLAAAEGRADGLRRERNGLQARHAVLSRWQHDLSGYHAGVRTVLAASRAGQGARLAGIVGVVGELLHVPAQYETAIEVALGGRLQDVVVNHWSDAEAAIDLLKRNRAGRATFLPLDTLREGPSSNPFGGQGVLGLGCDLISFDPAHTAVARYLLGRTLVVQDLSVARRVLKGCPSGWQIVTLAGEVVRSSGAVTGGTTSGQQGGLLAQEREWRELPARMKALEAELGEAEVAVQAARENLRRARLGVEQARRREREIAAARQRVEGDLNLGRRETDRARRALAQATASLATAVEACADLRARQIKAETELAELARSREAGRARLEQARRALAAVEADDGDHAHQLSTARAALAGAQREEARLARELAEREQESGERRRAVESLAEEQSRLRAHLEELAATLAESEAESVALSKQNELLAASQGELRANLAGIESDLAVAEDERRRLYARQSELGAVHAAAEAAVERARAELVTLRERAGGDLGERDEGPEQLRFPWDEETEETAVGEGLSPELLRRQIDHLRAQLRGLSAVNPDAVRDYEELSGRHAFLTAQHADLLQAARSLRQAIADLEVTMARQFERTFVQVATEFRHCFTALFGGGTARLTLTQPDNIQETGIDIVAQPPGKRWQSLALLSGGERALTAVALLFALLRVKPAPFCVLDEIDAALDDANVLRCAQMIASLSERTQFVVVTHNKGTMQAAGALYGVTMARDGVSRMVSLRLADLPEDEEAVQSSSP